MTQDEFDRIKEEEKAHLRDIRRLKKMAREMKAKRSVQAALDRMLRGSREVLDTHDEMIRKLALETARNEARLDVALETESSRDPSPEAGVEERARTLLERMRTPTPQTDDERTRGEHDARRDEAETKEAEQNDKTLGQKQNKSSSSSPPRKTLGRQR